MAYEQKPNTGSLFKNDRKETESHPDYKGSALIDGLGDCWLDAWINTAKDGSKYMSLKLKPKEVMTKQKVQDRRLDGSTIEQHPAPADLDDDVPF